MTRVKWCRAFPGTREMIGMIGADFNEHDGASLWRGDGQGSTEGWSGEDSQKMQGHTGGRCYSEEVVEVKKRRHAGWFSGRLDRLWVVKRLLGRQVGENSVCLLERK